MLYNEGIMGQALYRKYRSKSLSEIVGQEHIKKTLANALKNGTISHAYLFTGPRGVGKTSIARILAYEVNGIPYDESNPAIDIIEIDAASNRRIDEIRDLRDKVHIAPAYAKYKVYIIDEVHMLTKEAFNALLKTLEEPPAHAIFILATTEVHKLPDTIISRTQRFTFKPVDQEKTVAHLSNIAKKEHISIDQEALELIAEHGEGSFRDSISLLDQASNIRDTISAEDIRTMLGVAPLTAIEQLLDSTKTSHTADVAKQLSQLKEAGYEAAQIAKQLSALLRTRLLDSSATDALWLMKLLGDLLEVPTKNDQTTFLELTLLEANLRAASKPQPETHEPVKQSKELPEKPKNITPKPKEVKQSPTTVEPAPSISAPVTDIMHAWDALLDEIKVKYNTLYGVLKMGVPKMDESNTIICTFRFAFHQKRINEPKNKKLIHDILAKQFGMPVQLSCVVDSKPPEELTEQGLPVIRQDEQENKPLTAADVDTISNIFGGAEVIES